MKKTLAIAFFAAMVCASSAIAAEPTITNGDTLTFATTGAYSTAYATVGGFVINFKPTAARYSVTDVTTSQSLTSTDVLDSTFTLSTITFNPRSTNSSVYLYFVDKSTETIAAVSSVKFGTTDTGATAKTVDLSADKITLNTGTQYAIVFASSTNNLTVGESALNADGTTYKNYTNFIVALTAENSAYASEAGTWGTIYKNSSTISDGLNNYAPILSITGTMTPEPATATLSLLALAGLAARRRRK